MSCCSRCGTSTYDHLAALTPDPVVELNRAAAIARAGDVAGGLARIEALVPALDGYQYFHAARADLLRRLGADTAAAEAYARALKLAGNAAERSFLERRLAETRQRDSRCSSAASVAWSTAQTLGSRWNERPRRGPTASARAPVA